MVSRTELEHIAYLARISLSDEEKEEFTEQLNAILEYFSILDELDEEVRDVEPLHHVFSLVNVFRDDVEGESLAQEDVLGMAPEKEDEYIKGPRIV